jgi:hypothetical protein
VHLLLHLGLPQLRPCVHLKESITAIQLSLPPRQPQLQPAPAGIAWASAPAILLTILFQTKSTHKDGQAQNCAVEQSPSGLMRSGSEERMSAVERMGANNEYNAFRMELTA